MTITFEKLPELAQIYNFSFDNFHGAAIYLTDEQAKCLYKVLEKGCQENDYFNPIGNFKEILDEKYAENFWELGSGKK